MPQDSSAVLASYPGFYRLQYEKREAIKSLGRPGYEASAVPFQARMLSIYNDCDMYINHIYRLELLLLLLLLYT